MKFQTGVIRLSKITRRDFINGTLVVAGASTLPFAGSSQVVQCAKELNRQYVGCEIDKEAYDMAIIRTSLV